MTPDEAFVQWIKISIACFVGGVVVTAAILIAHDLKTIIDLLQIIANGK